MFFLSGWLGFYLLPLAEAVSFAMLASLWRGRLFRAGNVSPELRGRYHAEEHIGEKMAFSGAINRALKKALKISARISQGFARCAPFAQAFRSMFSCVLRFLSLARRRSWPDFFPSRRRQIRPAMPCSHGSAY